MGKQAVDPSGPFIRVRGARVHNLRGLDVDIPRDRLVVLTGVSGSGKSSLAFDTLHAEGRRRFLEGLAPAALGLLDQGDAPAVDRIEGLPPTVALDQRAADFGPRATVSTVSEVANPLRVLYARLGTPHCPRCGQAIRPLTVDAIVGAGLALGEGRRVLVLAPMTRDGGPDPEALDAIRRAGLLRARVDGEVVEVGIERPAGGRKGPKAVEAVVDRLVIREGIAPRLTESVRLALKLGAGAVILSADAGEGRWDDHRYTTRLDCPACGLRLREIEPRTFSAFSPYGACPRCEGLGTLGVVDVDRVIPDRSRSIAGGAVRPWAELPQRLVRDLVDESALDAFLRRKKRSREQPLKSWPEATCRAFLEGDTRGFAGVLPPIERAHREAATDTRKAALAPYLRRAACPDCGGSRLGPEGRAVTIADRSFPDLMRVTVPEARDWLLALRFAPPDDAVAGPLIAQSSRLLDVLDRLGLGYLTLDRAAESLSGGEVQRVRLAAQIGSGLLGACYILDEPTGGLHPRDTHRLIEALRELRDLGNSLVIVEHDEAVLRAADWILDLGPGAGPDGGRLVAQGPPEALVEVEPGRSVTKWWLEGGDHRGIGQPSGRLERSPGTIMVRGATGHHLKDVDAAFPLGGLTAVAGVSGSGKSTLVMDTLAPAASRALGKPADEPAPHRTVAGLDAIDGVIVVDRRPIGRSPRSSPATYTGLFDAIRKLFARTREAKLRGFAAGQFSLNVRGGRCEVCRGAGVRRIAMGVLPPIDVRCEACGGRRFDRSTLAVTFKGRSIADVLDLRVEEARALFAAIPPIRKILDALHEAGLGYLAIGQPANTLSGGEAQRVKLATDLARPAAASTLYILDEPTAGLHAADVEALLGSLVGLTDRGHTVVVIEHNPAVLLAADWLIDLGPGAGVEGGRVVAQGPPAEVAGNPASVTGPYLK